MEAFRGVLKRRMVLYTVLLLLFVTASVAAPTLRQDMPDVDAHTLELVRGFQSGLCAGLAILLIWQIARCLRALRNPNACRSLFVLERDERRRFIQDKVGGFAYNLAMGIAGAAGCIAGYFNLTVATTLICALVGMALLRAGFKIYYRRRF